MDYKTDVVIVGAGIVGSSMQDQLQDMILIFMIS